MCPTPQICDSLSISDTTNRRSERYHQSGLAFGLKDLEAPSVGRNGLFNRHRMYVRYIVSRNLKILSVPSMHTTATQNNCTVTRKCFIPLQCSVNPTNSLN